MTVSRPKRLAQTAKVGQRHAYDDGRSSTGSGGGLAPVNVGEV